MKVLLVGPYPKEEDKIQGGVEAVLHYLADGLVACSGSEVHVLTCVKGLSSAQRRTSRSGVNVHFLPLHEKWGCLSGFAVDASRIRKVLHEIKPSIIHVHTQVMYPHAVLNQGYPAVLTAHGVFFREAELARGLLNRVQSRLGCVYERRALRRATHLILTSKYLEDVYGSLVEGRKVYFVDNAIDDAFFQTEAQEEPGALLFAGAMIERKGVLHMVQAAAILRDQGAQFQLWIAGPAVDPAYYEAVQRCVADSNLQESVQMLGLIDQTELLSRFARCSGLLLPSFEETAPMVIAQAQAIGKPVIASNSGGIPYMVTEGETGYLVPFGDVQALAERMGRLLSDGEGRRRMGAAARRIAEQRFLRSAVVDKTMGVYQDVLRDWAASRTAGRG